MRRKLMILCSVVLGLSAHAQLSFTSFQDLIEYADEHALVVKQALINEQLSDSEYKEAKFGRLPSINASFGYNDNISLQPTLVPERLFNPNAESDNLQELTFGTKFQYSRTMQVQWDVINFQQKFATQTAEIAVQESRLNTDLARFNTYNSLASTYYSLLLNREAAEIYAENLRVSEQVFAQATQKLEDGLISEAELNRAEINLHQNKSRFEQTTNQIEQLQIQLQSQLNTSEPVVVSDSVGSFVLVNSSIATNHPEVSLQALQLNRYESMLRQAKAQRLPTVSLLYQNNQTWATNEFLNFSDGNNLPQQSFGIQISMSSIFDLGTKQRIRQAKKQVELQQLIYDNSRLTTQREDDLLVLQLQQANNQLDNNQRILSLQERNDVHTENQYQAGLLSLEQRLDKYSELLSAQDNYLQSLASSTLAKYKIFIRQINF
ncbi:MAG: TolC family protein [Bacteroidota bacterium]